MTLPPTSNPVHDHSTAVTDDAERLDNESVTAAPSRSQDGDDHSATPDLHDANVQANPTEGRALDNPQGGLIPDTPFHRGLPPEIQSLLAGVLAAVGAPPATFLTHFNAGHYRMQPGADSANQPTSQATSRSDDGLQPGAGAAASSGAEDPRAFFRQQFAQFAEALRQTPSSRADPERAEELLRGLKDPGQTVLRRLVRICEVEDARGDSNEGVQCGICLDTITEIYERASTPKVSTSSAEPAVCKSTKGADITSEAGVCSPTDPVDPVERIEIQDVEMLVDGQQGMDTSEKTTFKAFPCHHLFCAECLLPWLSTHTTCPTCRLDIDPHSVTLRRQMSRQRRSTTIRPTTSRSAGERNLRIAGTPSAWRFLRAPSRPQETLGRDASAVAEVLPSRQPDISDAAGHPASIDTSQTIPDTSRHDANTSVQSNAGPQPQAMPSSRITGSGAPFTGPMGNIPIVFFTGNPLEPVAPSEIGSSGPASAPSSGPTAHDSNAVAQPMFLTIDLVREPPAVSPGTSNPEGAGPSTPNDTMGRQNVGSTGGPEHAPRQHMAAPALFAFPPNFLGMGNPFAPPGDLTYTRSSAPWTPPTPKNSLQQWLLKRERELNIVCDDPHCKYICPDIISNFDDALTHVQAFGSHDQLCEHKHHVTCLVEGNQSTGWYRVLNQEAKQAALRCLQCRNHGWIDVPASQSDIEHFPNS